MTISSAVSRSSRTPGEASGGGREPRLRFLSEDIELLSSLAYPMLDFLLREMLLAGNLLGILAAIYKDVGVHVVHGRQPMNVNSNQVVVIRRRTGKETVSDATRVAIAEDGMLNIHRRGGGYIVADRDNTWIEEQAPGV